MKLNKRIVFVAIILVSLFIIFFVGRKFDATTGQRYLAVVSDGVTHFRKGLDVSGGTRLIFRISYDKYEKVYEGPELTAIKKLIEDIVLKNIDGRISKLGVSDYKAYVQNLNDKPYIVVEIGGIADLDQAKEIIGKTVELEFKLQNTETPNAQNIKARKDIALKLLPEIKASKQESIAHLVNGKMSENIYYNAFSGATLEQLPEIYQTNNILSKLDKGETYNSLLDGIYTTIKNQDQYGAETGIDLKGWTIVRLIDKSEVQNASGETVTLYSLEDVFVQDRETWVSATDDNNNILNGAYFKYANTSSSEIGEPVVAINLDDKGKEVFCNITDKNIGNPMAIFVGGELLTAPTIQSKICGGTAQIDGSFTAETAKELVDALNDGALPAPLVLMQEEKISPTLGDNALNGALLAALVGFIAICVLIFVMYGFKKMILTAIVLASFLIVLSAFIKLTDYALSLAGIAAIVLSIGMVVDANILIYERFIEEIKGGRSPEGAVDVAKDRSRSAIRDGQLSAGLIALLLFTMGINIFKGFGAMMLITLLLTLLFNVPLIKELMHIFYDKKNK